MNEVWDLENEIGALECAIEDHENDITVLKTRRLYAMHELRGAMELQDLDSNE